MNWELIVAIAAFVVSLGALIFSAYTYSKHDKKIKAQEQIINDYQINKIKKEDEESRKANIKGNIYPGNKGKLILKVFNSGKAIARNIRVEGLDVDSLIVIGKELLPYELMNPQDNTELTLWKTKDSPSTIRLRYIWDDDFGQNNEFEQVLTL
jgi:hypothetical protein